MNRRNFLQRAASGAANRMNFRLLDKSGLKRFLIVQLLSTLALLSPIVSLAQQPTTMSAKSVAKLPFSPGLELGRSSSLQAACARNSKNLPDRSYLALFDAGLAPEQTENSSLRTGGWSWR
jgi:hypothetical protein